MWRLDLISKKAFKSKTANQNDISFFDVKELYDAAYAEKEKTRINIKRFKQLMAKAALMDMAYRAQLSKAQPFQYKKAA